MGSTFARRRLLVFPGPAYATTTTFGECCCNREPNDAAAAVARQASDPFRLRPTHASAGHDPADGVCSVRASYYMITPAIKPKSGAIKHRHRRAGDDTVAIYVMEMKASGPCS